jgi:hypothetical protein
METAEVQTAPEAEKQHVSLFLREARSYITARENLYGRLMEIPLEVFAQVIQPAIASPRLLTRESEDEQISLFKEVVMEVVRVRSICICCYKGQVSHCGGHNGGEGYTRCSNLQCVSHDMWT